MRCCQPTKRPFVVQRRFQAVDVDRAIEPAANVVFARPLQLDRDAVGAERLGDRDRLDNVVGAHVGAPAEAAAGEQRVDVDLLRLEPGGRRRVALVDGLELVAGPDLATVGVEFHDRIQRLHRRVRQIGKLVRRTDSLGGALERGGDIAVVARRHARLFGQRPVLGHDRGRASLFRLAVVPLDLERLAALLCRPEALGDNGDAARHLHHVDHAGDGLGRGGVERLYRRAEQRRTLQQRHQHVREGHVDGELRRAVGLGRNVDARQFLADELEVFRLLQRHLVRHRQAGRLGGQCAERRLAIARRMMDNAALDRQARRRHIPFRCGSGNQHGPRRGARLAQLHPGISHSGTAAGPLHAESEIGVFAGVGRRGFDAYLRPIGIELLGDDRREAGIGALAHFKVLGDHRHAIVRRDPQERVRREVFGGGVRQCAAQGAGPIKADGEACSGRGRALQESASARRRENGCRFAHGSALHRVRGRVDGGADSGIGRTPTNVSPHGVVDVRIIWFGFLLQERRRGHDLARLAIAALRNLQVDPGGLHGFRRFAGDAFDGGDVLALQRPRAALRTSASPGLRCGQCRRRIARCRIHISYRANRRPRGLPTKGACRDLHRAWWLCH